MFKLKRLYPLLTSLLLLAFVAFGLRVKASPAVPPVFDVKSAPGQLCHGVVYSDIPHTVSDLYNEQLVGAPQLVSGSLQGGEPSSVTVICPIVRDRILDSIGIRTAWIDVTVNPVVINGILVTSRKVQCRLEETTGAYMSQFGGLLNAMASGPYASTPVTADGFIKRLNLTIPAVPSQAAQAGASFNNGYADIACILPSFASIQGYGWMEYGGETTDW